MPQPEIAGITRHRGNIEDMPRVLPPQVRHCMADHIQCAEYIDIETPAHFFVAQFFEGACLAVSGIVDHHIKTANAACVVAIAPAHWLVGQCHFQWQKMIVLFLTDSLTNASRFLEVAANPVPARQQQAGE